MMITIIAAFIAGCVAGPGYFYETKNLAKLNQKFAAKNFELS